MPVEEAGQLVERDRVDLVIEIDVAGSRDESVEKDMIAVRIGPDWRLVAVASPAYLDMHGVPQHPQNLVRHVCINMRHETAGGLYAWEFEKDGQELRVRSAVGSPSTIPTP